MAKKLGLNLGNREIKPAAVIEETHATPAPVADNKPAKRHMEPVSRRKRAKKDWTVKSVRLETSEFEKVETHMKEHEISFNALVRELLEEKGIL